MKTPWKTSYDVRRQTSNLVFVDHIHDGEYYIRGGICWPETEDGFALLAGQNIDTKQVVVFKQVSFLTVDHILGVDRSIEYQGLCSFFNHCWSKYFGQGYYWNQGEELHKRFLLDVIRSPMIEPKPNLIKAPYTDDDPNRLIFEYMALGRLKIDTDSVLYRQLQHSKKDGKAKLPAVHALGCVLAGYRRFPWRDYDED